MVGWLVIYTMGTFDPHFIFISLWELNVNLATRVPVQSAQKPYAVSSPT